MSLPSVLADTLVRRVLVSKLSATHPAGTAMSKFPRRKKVDEPSHRLPITTTKQDKDSTQPPLQTTSTSSSSRIGSNVNSRPTSKQLITPKQILGPRMSQTYATECLIPDHLDKLWRLIGEPRWGIHGVTMTKPVLGLTYESLVGMSDAIFNFPGLESPEFENDAIAAMSATLEDDIETTMTCLARHYRPTSSDDRNVHAATIELLAILQACNLISDNLESRIRLLLVEFITKFPSSADWQAKAHDAPHFYEIFVGTLQ